MDQTNVFLQLVQMWYFDCSQAHLGNASKCKWSRKILHDCNSVVEYCKGFTTCAVDQQNTQKSRLQPCISIRQLFVFLIEPWQSALRGEQYTHCAMSSSNKARHKPITSTAQQPQQRRQITCVTCEQRLNLGQCSETRRQAAPIVRHRASQVSVVLCQLVPALLLSHPVTWCVGWLGRKPWIVFRPAADSWKWEGVAHLCFAEQFAWEEPARQGSMPTGTIPRQRPGFKHIWRCHEP